RRNTPYNCGPREPPEGRQSGQQSNINARTSQGSDGSSLDPFFRLGEIRRCVDVEKRAQLGVHVPEGSLRNPMHPELRTHAEVLHLQAAGLDQGAEDRQAGFRVHSVHGLEFSCQVRNDDVAGQGLVEDDADCGRREPRHVARGSEDPVMRGEMQARVQPAEGGAPRNEVHDDLGTQRHEWFRRIRDDQNLLEETLIGIDYPLVTGTPATLKTTFVAAWPAAFATRVAPSG